MLSWKDRLDDGDRAIVAIQLRGGLSPSRLRNERRCGGWSMMMGGWMDGWMVVYVLCSTNVFSSIHHLIWAMQVAKNGVLFCSLFVYDDTPFPRPLYHQLGLRLARLPPELGLAAGRSLSSHDEAGRGW